MCAYTTWKIITCMSLTTLLLLERILCLRLLELRVPPHVPLDTRAVLACSWQLGPSEVLYTVKWYKDGKEFFRHVPRDLEPQRKYPLPGVVVEDYDSTGSNVTLAPATTATEGRYRCEVSGERPLFPTVSDHADMIVVALPDHGPIISGSRPRYAIGDTASINCRSGRSRPPTRLAWYVNGEPAPGNIVTTNKQLHLDGRVTTSVKLEFNVTEHHFRNSGLKIKCLATIGTIYWRSNEESAQRERIKAYQTIEMRKHSEQSNVLKSSSSGGCRKMAQVAMGTFLFFMCCLFKYAI